MMQLYGDATEEVVALLTSAGISASEAPENLDLPGVWVTPGQPSVMFEFQDPDKYLGRWDLFLVSPDLPSRETANHLSDLLARVREVFGAAVTEASAVTIQLPNHSSGSLPALLTTIDQEVTP